MGVWKTAKGAQGFQNRVLKILWSVLRNYTNQNKIPYGNFYTDAIW
jgi:hypothetical protein